MNYYGRIELTSDVLVDRLDMLISRLKGECVDCKTPCGKAHKSHTGECECCKWMREW